MTTDGQPCTDHGPTERTEPTEASAEHLTEGLTEAATDRRSRPDPRPERASGGQSTVDDSGSTILHVDMDAFFAAVEVRRRPELRGRPVIVGGGVRGVVLSATYEARRYGVRSAMPMGRARRMCPAAVIVPPDQAAYRSASNEIMAVFREITPLVAPLSVDEAFLDVAGARRRLGSPATIASAIRARVAATQGLTCSVGVAPSMMVAKIASALCKPDGLLVVPADGVTAFLHPLPVSTLWGVGARTGQTLERLGLRNIGDLAATPLATLQRAVGAAVGAHLAALAAGVDDRAVTPNEAERSVGAETTFETDVTDTTRLARELLALAERSAGRLREGGFVGRTISIKVRHADFTTITRSRSLPEATDVTQLIYATARGLLDGLGPLPALRLLGVRIEAISAVTSSTHQLELGERALGWREADRAVDRAASRFGRGAVRPASLIGQAEPSEPGAGATPGARLGRRGDSHGPAPNRG
ncbi:MAG: DNA polymerase IV [Frankia sp.]